MHHAPVSGGVRQALVYVHPFAEEMNKSRRMAARQARAFAARGTAVLQLDLLGCGDSSGDFSDATWRAWVDDVLLGYEWLRRRHNVPVGFWGLRAGCLLAAEAACRLDEPSDFLFWQPVTSGKAHLAQFLRLLSAAAWTGGADVLSVKDARAQLDAGKPVDIAGYRMAADLALGLEGSMLQPPPAALRGVWIDVGAESHLGTSPATQGVLDRWNVVHQHLHTTRVVGPPFWQTQEIEDAPALLEATASLFQTSSRQVAHG